MRERALAADWYYGWIVVAAGFVAATVLFGLSYSFGVFLEPLSRSFPVGTGTLALTFGVQTFVVYTGSVPGGTIVDGIGARRSSLVATVLLVSGLVGASAAQSFLVLLATYGVLAGTGMSLLYAVAYTAVPRWFHRRRGLAMGVASSGLGIGLLVVAPTAAALVERYGWRGAYLVLGAGAGIVLLVATYFLADDPAATGSSPDGEFPDGRPPRPPDSPLVERLGDIGDVVTSGAFAALFLGWLFIWSPLYILMNHVVRFAAEAGLGTAVGVAALSVVGVATSLARIGVGFASDRVGRVRTFAVSGALVATAVPAVTLVEGRLAFLALAAVFGVGYGGAGSLLSPLVAELFGSDSLGTVFGVASVSFAISGLAAPSLAGVLYGWYGGYGPVFWIAGGVGLVGVVLVLLAGFASD